jgi:hypothetical protein
MSQNSSIFQNASLFLQALTPEVFEKTACILEKDEHLFSRNPIGVPYAQESNARASVDRTR